MSDYIYAPKQDLNHAEVSKWYEELYCKVIDTHKVGGGFGDLVVKIPTQNGPVIAIVEVKRPDGHLTPKQHRFMAEWGSAVEVITSRDEVFAHVERVRNKGRV